MGSPDKLRKRVLKAYPKAVVHLRRQFEDHRFGLVLGAGVSKDFNVPLWEELVKKIAADRLVKGRKLITGDAGKSSLPYKTALLFQHFRKNEITKLANRDLSKEQENWISATWLRLCATYLYKNKPKNLKVALNSHPYFQTLLPLIRGSQLTVNFNFDDYVEHALNATKLTDDKGNRGYEAVTNPWSQFRRRGSVIYHPHGFCP